MLFNSIEFAIFLPIVFFLYWAVFNKKIKVRNLFLTAVSYLFYGWWDWRFLFLLIFSSLVDFFASRAINNSTESKKKKIILIVALSINLGILGFFKYFNFFVDNFYQAFTFLGNHFDKPTLKIILPVGISFYTFQTMSYTIDVYRKKLEPSKDLISYMAYVTFFPQLVAGPIERAINLLPQFYTKKTFHYQYATDGLRQMLWGFFKKVVIADNASIYVNEIFSNYTHYSGSTLLWGAILFAIQIYGDFSGYSDIAIGTAKIFGFRLMKNFAFPYFSRDIAEFWRRWHISLSSWFKDYVYIPLGGSRVSKLKSIRNTFIIFILSGFWHGANWTFVVWGALNAIYFLPLLIFGKNRHNINIIAEHSFFPPIKEFFQMIVTFLLTVLAWVFFRSENLNKAFDYLKNIFTNHFFTIPHVNYTFKIQQAISQPTLLLMIVFFTLMEWFQRTKNHALQFNKDNYAILRWSAYLVVAMLIILFGNFDKTEFIYFAF